MYNDIHPCFSASGPDSSIISRLSSCAVNDEMLRGSFFLSLSLALQLIESVHKVQRFFCAAYCLSLKYFNVFVSLFYLDASGDKMFFLIQ